MSGTTPTAIARWVLHFLTLNDRGAHEYRSVISGTLPAACDSRASLDVPHIDGLCPGLSFFPITNARRCRTPDDQSIGISDDFKAPSNLVCVSSAFPGGAVRKERPWPGSRSSHRGAKRTIPVGASAALGASDGRPHRAPRGVVYLRPHPTFLNARTRTPTAAEHHRPGPSSRVAVFPAEGGSSVFTRIRRPAVTSAHAHAHELARPGRSDCPARRHASERKTGLCEERLDGGPRCLSLSRSARVAAYDMRSRITTELRFMTCESTGSCNALSVSTSSQPAFS